jgi:hypothetical protein
MNMKKTTIIVCLALFAFISCDEQFDIPDYSAINSTVWDSEQSATLYINGLYRHYVHGFGGNAAGGLETMGSQNSVLTGEFGLNNEGTLKIDYYQNIRNTNIAIEELEKGGLEQKAKNALLGQALFIRAQLYFDLVKLYGGVPLVLHAQDPVVEGDAIYVPRSTAKVCFEQIIADLNAAVEMLPPSYLDGISGRVTRMAAAAYLGRVWLHFASPLYNPQNDVARWDSAYAANTRAKQICDAEGKGLLDLNLIWLEENSIEYIWSVPYSIAGSKVHSWDSGIRPISESSRASGAPSCTPTWDIVKLFPMKDGKAITESSNYDELRFWQNRDPRFVQAVAWNGCVWTLNAQSERKQWTYRHATTPSYNDQERAGMATSTGFYCRKMSNPNLSKAALDDAKCEYDWIEIRYAEVLLNLAEAANAVGNTQEAYGLLGQIRKRAGIEAGADELYGLSSGMNVDQMRKTILDERAIELLFENKRYWDLRRYRLFTDDLPGYPNSKLNGTKREEWRTSPKLPHTVSSLNGNANKANDINDNNYGDYFTATARPETNAINFLETYYFFAITEDVLKRCITVEQTIGWENGTFDPLSDVK